MISDCSLAAVMNSGWLLQSSELRFLFGNIDRLMGTVVISGWLLGALANCDWAFGTVIGWWEQQ